ncbi:saccharopine dehydrogenase NADP-binding domain-containing protein [Gammaproteobacteria bacterium]|nr:saccharopine dehydrogenase NADP-binding domain-containing protein [Gammaproteobacteria bacterium]
MQREYDVVIWGATGFTGKLVTRYMKQNYLGGNLKWAVAGRDSSKLAELGIPETNRLLANSNDKESIDALVQKARVILTTVGPYARYGRSLVEACATQGTHYCDLTGEVYWMREMIEAFASTAKESGARIVHTCGFDSIPSDLGAYFLQKEMIGRYGIPSNHIKYRTVAFKGGFSGGTADSMIAMMENAENDPNVLEIGKDPYALNFESRGPDGQDVATAFYDDDFDAWVGPFMMAQINTRVVRRTNELLNFRYGKDFRYDEGTLVGRGSGAYLGANAVALGMKATNGLSGFKPTRKLLQKIIPKPGEGPTEEIIQTGFFTIELIAKHPFEAEKNLKARVTGDQDPGYGSTAKMLAESALALAQDDLPVEGGFWTPASAMGEALLKRLPMNAGVNFSLID